MTTFVLVPDAGHGGWWFQPVVDRLTGLGHTAAAVTLSGLGRLDDLRRMRPIDLDVHISEATGAVVAHQDYAGAVLVGHGYGGVVITGVADRLPTYVRALVYLDGFVPQDGDSTYDLADDDQRARYLAEPDDGSPGVAPPPSADPRARPHPRGALLQPITLVGAWEQVPARHYVATTRAAPTLARIRTAPGWTVHEWPAEEPDRVVELLAKV